MVSRPPSLPLSLQSCIHFFHAVCLSLPPSHFFFTMPPFQAKSTGKHRIQNLLFIFLVRFLCFWGICQYMAQQVFTIHTQCCFIFQGKPFLATFGSMNPNILLKITKDVWHKYGSGMQHSFPSAARNCIPLTREKIGFSS